MEFKTIVCEECGLPFIVENLDWNSSKRGCTVFVKHQFCSYYEELFSDDRYSAKDVDQVRSLVDNLTNNKFILVRGE